MTVRRNWIPPEVAAKYLGVSPKTLAKWRCQGTPNIPYSKVGRCVRYCHEDLEQYLADNTTNQQCTGV